MDLKEKNGLLPFPPNYKGRRVRRSLNVHFSLLNVFSQWAMLLLMCFSLSSFLVSGVTTGKNVELKVTSISPLTPFLVFRSTTRDERLTLEKSRFFSSTQSSQGAVTNDVNSEDTKVNANMVHEYSFNSATKNVGHKESEKQQPPEQWQLQEKTNEQETNLKPESLPNVTAKPKQTLVMESLSNPVGRSEDLRKPRSRPRNRFSYEEKIDSDLSFYEDFNDNRQPLSTKYDDDASEIPIYRTNPQTEISMTKIENNEDKCPPSLFSKEIEWRKKNGIVVAFLPYMEPSTCDPPVKCSISTTVNRHIHLQEGDSLDVMIQGPPNLAPSRTLQVSLPPNSPTEKGDAETNRDNANSWHGVQSKQTQMKQSGNEQQRNISETLGISPNNSKKAGNIKMRNSVENSSTKNVTKVNFTSAHLLTNEDHHPHSPEEADGLMSSSPSSSPSSSTPLRRPEQQSEKRKRRRAAVFEADVIADRRLSGEMRDEEDYQSVSPPERENMELNNGPNRNSNGVFAPSKHNEYLAGISENKTKTKRKVEKTSVIVKRSVTNDSAKTKTIMTTGTPIGTSSLTIWKVTKTEWNSCSTREGGQVAQSTVGGVATIERESLPVGNNYFIGRSSWSSSECFKLKVQVRTSDCGEGSICSGKGICFANETMEEYECGCCKGYTGRHCEERDACTDSPCLNAGFCLDIEEGHDGETFQCLCPYGYRGRFCETPTSLCDSNPCQNGGFCEGNHTSYNCRCSPGWAGSQCLEESTIFATEELEAANGIPFVDDNLNKSNDEKGAEGCRHSPCQHGICVETTSQGYRCFCEPGFVGNTCELDYNECFSNPCPNGGTCIDKNGGFQCLCGPGYEGTNCMIKVNMCMPDPCPPDRICIDRGNSHSCECVQELSDDCGIHEEICDPNPCAHGGSCYPISETLSFYCACRPGFTGQTCHGKDHHIRIPGHKSGLKTADIFRSSSDHIISSNYEDASILESVGPYGTAKSMGELDLQHSSFSSNPLSHIKKLYTGAVTLACAFIIFLLVVSICHCRVNRPYSKCSLPLPRPSFRFLPFFTRGRSSSLRDKKRRYRSSSMRIDHDTDAASPSMTSYANADSVFYNMDVYDNQELPLIK